MARYHAVLLISSCLSAIMPFGTVMAQQSDSGFSGASAGSSDTDSADAAPEGVETLESSKRAGRGQSARAVTIKPYIEAEQIVTARNIPRNETFTYTRLSAGVEGSVVGRNNAASVSLRYERQIDWGDHGQDGDAITGIANGYATVTPGLKFHAGGLATRGTLTGNGSSLPGSVIDQDNVVQVYSVYAGPSLATQVDDVTLTANYRLGYTKTEQDGGVVIGPGVQPLDLLDESVVQMADAMAVIAPGDLLPVGVGVGGSYYREDISNLDQRVEDAQVRATTTVPLSHSVALTGAIGYEHVKISGRDAVLDGEGRPVLGPDGNYITDKSSPRVIAYDMDGLIWDVGVMWRPSSRTSLTASVGRRYGSTSYTGTFRYAPSNRTSFGVAVYDNVAGFGGQMNRALEQLPTDFTAIRDPLSGNIGGCVSSLEGGSCVNGALGSMRSTTFRARGVMANYSMQLGRISTGIGAGYDRRKFIAAPGTVLALANGLIDENYWLSAYLNATLDERSGIQTNIYANWLESGRILGGDAKSWGAQAAYYRYLTSRLSARAAVGVEGSEQTLMLDDYWTASALVGVRYSF